MSEQLAIAGGTPVRSGEFPDWPVFDGKDAVSMFEMNKHLAKHVK